MPGKFVLEEGKVEFDEATRQVKLTYVENWTGTRLKESQVARLKSNGKFQCESKRGAEFPYAQKGRRLDTLPEDPGERLSNERARKYFARDFDRGGIL